MPLLTIEQAATELQLDPGWLDRWLRKNPDCYIPAGRKKRFDADDIVRIKQRLREGQRCSRSTLQGKTGRRRTGASGAPTSESVLTSLAALTNDPSLLPSATRSKERLSGKSGSRLSLVKT
jgi:hypothetical protein